MLFTVFVTTTTICLSELNVLLVYPACSKYKYNASEVDCHASEMSLSQRAHTALSLSVLFSVKLKGAVLSVKIQICCFSNFTFKYSQNHITAIVFTFCVAYLI